MWPFGAKEKVTPEEAPRRIVKTIPGSQNIGPRGLPANSKLAYDAYTNNGIMGGWGMSSASATVEAQGQITQIRNHARDLIRNNWAAARIIAVWASNSIGTGFDFIPDTDNKGRNEKLKALWEEFRWQMCGDGNPGGWDWMQHQASRGLFSDGEGFLRRKWIKPTRGRRFPITIDLLEADFCNHMYNTGYAPDQKNGVVKGPDGTEVPEQLIVNGIQYDKNRRVEGYWFYRDHPGNAGLFGISVMGFALSYFFVPENDASHFSLKQRPGQARGISVLAPVIPTLDMMNNLAWSYKVKQLTQANASIVITGCQGDGDGLCAETTQYNNETGLNETVQMVQPTMEPGTVYELNEGRGIQFPPFAQDATYPMVMAAHYRDAAAGVSMPFELMTGDLSQVNFASGKLGLLEFRRHLKLYHNTIFAPAICAPVWRWFVEAAYVAGLYDQPSANYKLVYPHIEGLDRKAEAQADEIELAAGLRSWDDVVRSRGEDPDKIMAENGPRLEQFKKLGFNPSWSAQPAVEKAPPQGGKENV